VQHVQIGARAVTGPSSAMRVDIVADMGAYPLGAFLPADTPARCSRGSIASRGSPSAGGRSSRTPLRSAPTEVRGRPEASACVERAMDLLGPGADDRDPRRTPSEEPDPGGGRFPLPTATDNGPTTPATTPQRSIARSLDLAGYEDLRRGTGGSAASRVTLASWGSVWPRTWEITSFSIEGSSRARGRRRTTAG
jgi:hypothetical protein